MKKKVSILFLLAIGLLSSCSIFKPGCHCPKVSYSAPSADKIGRNS
ncbi:hypothetical protein HDE68_002441 [Pedobacter cryoconitis]|uniref:Lipoprotein n=1 Tax=Pedobacter cryoconitis TaxID=188932 RepID=A0A7W8ZMG2_9SPHI|nr:hypothetical protein [Pedobacter cryoconitis]